MYLSYCIVCTLYAGITLRKTVREAVADVIEGTMQLIEVILNSPIQRYDVRFENFIY